MRPGILLRSVLLISFGLILNLSTAAAQGVALPPVVIEAESGALGDEFEIATVGETTYIAITTDFNETTGDGGHPGEGRTASYEVVFPEAGTYVLYARVYVGPQAWDDDSFFVGAGFGEKAPGNPPDWQMINGLAGVGYVEPSVYVEADGTAGSEIWKWVRLTDWALPADRFIVDEGNLELTFDVGAREEGLRIDKFAFGLAGTYYTVSNLDAGEPGVTEIPDLETTLIVDLGSPLRPVTHAASGALYGVTATLPTNIGEFVAPLNPRMYVQPARSGPGHQQPHGEALPVAERLASTTAEVTIRLPDINPGWPYHWPGWEAWEAEVRSVVAEKLASGLDNIYGYEIWNEQHGTWNTENGDFFADLWKPTYDLLRELDPDERIIGPSDSYYVRSRLEEFLRYCINNDCLPDVIAWHELGGSDNVSINVDNYRSLETSLGIGPLPISINEYSDSVHEYEGAPGVSAPFIARFERKGVESAAISWWFTNLPGRLGSLLTASNQRGGGWWFYKWYGDMTGTMVTVTPPRESGDGVDGFASLDVENQYASICFGGNYRGIVDVLVEAIPESFGDSVDVKVEYVPWTNKDTPVDVPVLTSRTTYDASAGSITVPVQIDDPLYGYRVYVTPKGVNTEAEHLPDPTAALALEQNYPNPFSQETRIRFRLPSTDQVKLEVYNGLGQRVAVLMDEQRAAGEYSIRLDAQDYTSGLYLYRLTTTEGSLTRAMVVVR